MKRRNVLVLNGGLPYQCWSWQHSIENIFEKKCYVLEEYIDFPLHSGNGIEIMKCPSVVLIKNHIHYFPINKYSKNSIFQRDDFHCQYCGRLITNAKEREIEHIIPRSDSNCPGSTFENTILACTTCNRQKGNRKLSEIKNEKCWNGKPFALIQKPRKPQNRTGYATFVSMVKKYNIAWLDYIPRWEYYAKQMNKEWLFDLYQKYLENKKNYNINSLIEQNLESY